MTTELAHTAHPDRPKAGMQGGFRIFLARLVLYWERLWPAMLPALGIIAILALFSLSGVWTLIPGWLHAGVLALAGAALAMTVWRDLRRVRWPTRRACQARLEEDGKLNHAPLQSLDDTPSNANLQDSPLWRAHLKASAERARAARLNGARDTVTARDPYGARFILAGLLAIAFVASGPDWRTRLVGLFTPGAGAYGAAVADLWIEPPAYTGKAPIYLMRAGDKKQDLAQQINAPAGAKVVAQINGGGRRSLSYAFADGDERARFEKDKDAARAEIILNDSGVLTLRLASGASRWPIGVFPDAAPLVSYNKMPTSTDQGLVEFSYIAEDDYGIATSRLEMRLDPDQMRPVDMPEFDEESLTQIRVVDMEGAGVGERAAVLDLQPDPWAGLSVLARVIVTDGAGQKGATKESAVTLPTRTFFNPLARTVVEQRQTLAVAADEWRRAGRSFDAVTMAPEVFYEENTGDFLLLRAAFWRVMRQDGENFSDAVDKFWPLALQLEDGAVELARQRLEAAEEALREAIERGASDEEIARLTEELRSAMDNYLAALAQAGEAQAQNNGGGQGQEIDKSNLDEMLDAIRDLAQSGAGNAARQMLSDLENILNNLRMSQRGGSGGSGQGQGAPGESGPSGKAGDLIGRQRELADEAFERGRNGGGEGENTDDLAEAESGLGRDLDELIDELQEGGEEADPNGEAARAMGRARNNMRQAENALRNGDLDAAASAMERAIGNMREGAEGLAREEMRQAGEGQDGGTRGGGTDPLGRPTGEAYGQGVDVPEESEAARTRAVIDELRKRLGDPDRTEDEIDYLERLLERF